MVKIGDLFKPIRLRTSFSDTWWKQKIVRLASRRGTPYWKDFLYCISVPEAYNTWLCNWRNYTNEAQSIQIWGSSCFIPCLFTFILFHKQHPRYFSANRIPSGRCAYIGASNWNGQGGAHGNTRTYRWLPVPANYSSVRTTGPLVSDGFSNFTSGNDCLLLIIYLPWCHFLASFWRVLKRIWLDAFWQLRFFLSRSFYKAFK